MKTLILLISAGLFLTTAAFVQSVAGASPAPSASASPAAKEYTCAMHPDVVKNKPGKCPKCGMKLEPKKEAEKPK